MMTSAGPDRGTGIPRSRSDPKPAATGKAPPRYLLAAGLALLAAGTVIALIPGLQAPQAPGFADKWLHAVFYGMVTLLVAGPGASRSWCAIAAVALLAHGLAVELLQPLVDRTASSGDLLANAAGVGLALAARPAVAALLRRGWAARP